MSILKIWSYVYLLVLLALGVRAYFLYRQISKHVVLGVSPIYYVYAEAGPQAPPDTLLTEAGRSIRRQSHKAFAIAIGWTLFGMVVHWTLKNLDQILQ